MSSECSCLNSCTAPHLLLFTNHCRVIDHNPFAIQIKKHLISILRILQINLPLIRMNQFSRITVYVNHTRSRPPELLDRIVFSARSPEAVLKYQMKHPTMMPSITSTVTHTPVFAFLLKINPSFIHVQYSTRQVR